MLKPPLQWWVILLASLLVSFVLFGRLIEAEFVGDDHTIVENNEALHGWKNLPQLFLLPAFPDKPSIRIYRPLTLASYSLNFVFSEQANGFHILNILIHAVNIFLVWLISRRWLSVPGALAVATVFAFLPIHTEAIAPVVGRSEVLSVCFTLLAIHFFLERRYRFSAVWFLAGLLAKDFVVFMLPVFGLWLWLEQRQPWSALKRGWWYLLTFGSYFTLRFIALGKYAFTQFIFDPVTAPVAFMTPVERFYTAFRGLFLYFRNTFWPGGLIPDYSYNQYPAVTNLFHSYSVVIGLVLFLGLIWLTIRGRGEVQYAALLVLVPFIFISNMFFVTSGSYADRWWYLPSFGVLVLLALAGEYLVKRWAWGRFRKIGLVFGVLVLGWYGYYTFTYAGIWRNDRTFYVAAAKKAPDNAWARSNLAAVYLHDQEFEKSREEIMAALAIRPTDVHALHILGKLYWQKNDFFKAEETFKLALENDRNKKNQRGLYRMLAFLYLDYGLNQQAFAMTQAALVAMSPDNEPVTKVDLALYDTIKRYSQKNPQRYTDQEKAELVQSITLVRGF